MRLRFTFIYAITSLVYLSCGISPEKKQHKELEILAREVMDIHDRTMADYGKLYGLKKKLLTIYDQETDSVQRNMINEIIMNLEKADKDMMDWMHQYHAPEDYLPFEEKKTYYLEQKSIIQDVEKITRSSINDAKKMIEKYPGIK